MTHKTVHMRDRDGADLGCQALTADMVWSRNQSSSYASCSNRAEMRRSNLDSSGSNPGNILKEEPDHLQRSKECSNKPFMMLLIGSSPRSGRVNLAFDLSTSMGDIPRFVFDFRNAANCDWSSCHCRGLVDITANSADEGSCVAAAGRLTRFFRL